MTELARVNVGDGGYGQNQLILSYELVSQSIEKNSSMVKFQISLYCPVWINTTSSKLVIDSSAGSIGEVSVGPSWEAGTHVLWTNGNTGWELGHNQDGTIDYTLSAKIVSTFLLSGTVSSKIPIPTIPRYATSIQSLNNKTENTITMNWSSDSTIDYIWYSTNNGSTWTGVDVTDGTSGTYKISGLSPNTSYNIKTRVRRKDSQLTTDSTSLAVTTYKVPTNTLSSKTETKVTVNWSVDSTADYIWYSINNGSSWVAVGSVNATSGSYTISSLSPNTAYTIKTRVRRKATQTTYDCSTVAVTTYNYPYITAVETSNLTIGNSQKLTLYNPLGRTVTIKMYQDSTNGTQLYSGTTSGTSITFTPTASTLYASIPSTKSSRCVYSAIYSSSTKTTGQYTYTINEANCKPTFNNFTYADTDSTIISLTGNNQILVNNNSNCKFTISTANKAVGKNSASIVKYKFEWGNKSSEANYSSSAEVTSTINDSTGNTLKVTAIDSRGLSTTVTKTITNVAYINATVDEVNIQRLNGIDVETYLGLKLNIWKGNWQNGSNTDYNNQLKYVAYRVYNGSEWTNYFDITSAVKTAMSSSSSGSTTTITVPLSKNLAIHANGSSGGFTIGKSYTIQVLIKDGTSSSTFTPSSYQATKQGTVPDGKVGFSRYKDSDGNYHYAINGMPDSNYTFKVYGTGYFANDVIISSAPATKEGSVPYSGGNIAPSTLTDMKKYKTYLGSIYLNNQTWYNMISTRHRNGATDGINYGMMLYSYLTSNGSLFWNKQINSTTWQGERTILDSSNYSNYALPKTGGDVTGSINITTSGTNFDIGYKQGGEVVLRHNQGGATVLSATEESIVFRPYGNNNTTNQASLDKSGNFTAIKFTGPLNGNATNVTQKKSLTTKSHSNWGTNNGYIPDMSFIAYWNGAFSSSNASNLTYAHQGIIQCKPISLYDNSTGTNGTVTLSQTAANFTYLEIFYKNDTGNINSTKVFIPNGKVALLETAFITKESNGNKTIQHQSKTVLISGTSISNTGTYPYIVSNVSHNGSSGSTWTDFTNSVKIIKVIGYK